MYEYIHSVEVNSYFYNNTCAMREKEEQEGNNFGGVSITLCFF